MRYCLDSWAVLRWLKGEEPAAGAVAKAMRGRPAMSLLNAAEVFYVLRRLAGDQNAVEVLDTLRARVELVVVDEATAVAAARIKADYPMALGDAFAAATAIAHNAVLLTGDPELLRGGPWRAKDLRVK